MTDVMKTAEMCHRVNKAWCEINGDMSQPDWANAPEWQRQSAISGVKMHLDNPNATDSMSHDSWAAEKVNDGWVYGEVKNSGLKTHPCLVSFDDLPYVDKIKDALFRSTVHSLN